jgi:hypothetical protein
MSQTFREVLREIVTRIYDPASVMMDGNMAFDFYRDEEAQCYRVQAWVTVPFTDIHPCPPPHPPGRCPQWPPAAPAAPAEAAPMT